MCVELATLAAIGAIAGAAGTGAQAVTQHQEGKSAAMESRRNARTQQATQEEALAKQKLASRRVGTRQRFAFGAGIQQRLAQTRSGTLLTGGSLGQPAGGKALLGQ